MQYLRRKFSTHKFDTKEKFSTQNPFFWRNLTNFLVVEVFAVESHLTVSPPQEHFCSKLWTGVSWNVPIEGWTATEGPTETSLSACWVSPEASKGRDRAASVGGVTSEALSGSRLRGDSHHRKAGERIVQLGELGSFTGHLLLRHSRRSRLPESLPLPLGRGPRPAQSASAP